MEGKQYMGLLTLLEPLDEAHVNHPCQSSIKSVCIGFITFNLKSFDNIQHLLAVEKLIFKRGKVGHWVKWQITCSLLGLDQASERKGGVL